MFTTIELFAGAGGLALGIEKAGFKTLALIGMLLKVMWQKYLVLI